MAVGVKFQNFVQDLGRAVDNLNGHVVAVYLSNTAPNFATGKVKADVPEIATGNGYAGPIALGNAYSQTGGVGIMTGSGSLTVTASGGSIGPFRYVVMWDQTANSLIAAFDYGAPITLLDTNTFTINLDARIITIT